MKSGKLNDFNNSKKLEDLGYTTSEVSLIEDSEDPSVDQDNLNGPG
jgi:hypothetical protein